VIPGDQDLAEREGARHQDPVKVDRAHRPFFSALRCSPAALMPRACDTPCAPPYHTLLEDADPVTDATLGGDTGLATLYDDHAKYFLAWRAKADSMPDLWAEPDRNGVFQRANEDHSTVSGSTLNVLTAKAAARADAHMNDMIAYLKELDPADPVRVAWDTATDGEKRRPAGRSNVSGRLSVRKHPWQQ